MSLKTLCRVCACDHSEDRLVDIFKICNQRENIAETINELTGLKVEIDDGLPSLCCMQCRSDLLSSVDIRRKCINSEKVIKSLLQDDTLQPGMLESLDPEAECGLKGTKQKASDISSMDKHTKKDKRDESNLNGPVANIEKSMYLDLDESTESSFEENVPDTSRQNHQCCGCSLCFDNENELMEHSRLIHATNQPLADKTRPFQCNICYRRAKTARGVQLHQSIMRNRWIERAPTGAVQQTSPALEQAETSVENDSSGPNNPTELCLDDTKPDVSKIYIFQNFQCSVCSEFFADLSSLQEHTEKTHNDEKVTRIKQEDCYEESIGNDEAAETNEFIVANEAQETNDPRYRCCGCSLGFDTESELMAHSRKVHAPNAPLPDKTKPVQCNICYGWYKTRRNLRDHQLYMCNRKFRCTICGMQFGRVSGLLRHKNTHSKAGIYPCKHCNKLFVTVYRRRYHEKKEHTMPTGPAHIENTSDAECRTAEPKLKIHTCCGCGLTFGTYGELKEHSHSIHAPNAPPAVESKPAQCIVCYRWYKSKRDVRNHQLGWRNRLLQCATCGKKFSRPSTLAEHENVHNKALIFSCTLCEEKFPNKSAKQRHVQRAHAPQAEAETAAKHVCSQCGKSFYSEGYLKQHMNLHADETPYKCRCGAQFKLKLYLARHMKIHSGQFTCKYCPAAFPCASLLKGHENSHTGNKEFSCEICGKQFYGKGDVRKHRQKVHEKKKRRVKASSR